MCFTPLVSIGTAAVEFSIAAYIIKIIKDPRLRLAPVFVLLLGFYQFTEFMLCKSGNPEIWSRIGFITYTFMPMVFSHFVSSVSDRKVEKILYIFPVSFSLLAVLHPNFIIYSMCNSLHVTSLNILYDQYQYLTIIYFIYYAIFPAGALYFFMKKYKNKFVKNIRFAVFWALVPLTLLLAQIFLIFWGIDRMNMEVSWIIMSILLSVVSLTILVLAIIPFYRSFWFACIILFIFASVGISVPILYIFFPIVGYDFPSIFCQFAFLYSIAILIFVEVFQDNSKIKRIKK